MSSNYFNNTRALITGGLGNIGYDIAKSLAEIGCNLDLLDKESDEDNKIQFLKTTYGIDVKLLKYDLLKEKSFSQIKNYYSKKEINLDFIVNNAAFYDETPGWGVDFENEGYEAWIKVMKVNLLAPFFLCQSLERILNKSKKASIVNISSIYGSVAPDFSIYQGTKMNNPAAYGASKGGLIQLTKWLSARLAPRVRVNCISPGGVERNQPQIFKKRYMNKLLLKRMANESDVSNAVKFLLSDQSTYITGQNMNVEGGFLTL